MYDLVESGDQTAPERPPQKGKVVCPWCDEVTVDGSENSRTYRACPSCENIFMDEFVRPYLRERRETQRRYRGRQYPEEFRDSAQEHMNLLLFVFSIIAIILLATVALNYFTGGRVPNLIQWAIECPAGRS
jgi:hypothetical protein